METGLSAPLCFKSHDPDGALAEIAVEETVVENCGGLHHAHAAVRPVGDEPLAFFGTNRTHRIGDEVDLRLRPLLEQSLDCEPVADVERDAVQHDRFRIERAEQRNVEGYRDRKEASKRASGRSRAKSKRH